MNSYLFLSSISPINLKTEICLGLTCSDENVRTKAHFAQEAGRVGLACVFPDTSPRGVNIEGEDDSWDFGSAAGFYVNATTPKWSKHYR